MGKVISIGKQNFASLRENDYFFVDKSLFIKSWWENGDEITLITRPRRFGKTLNMSMLECFFSNKYAQRSDLFEDLAIWKEEKYRGLQGSYPVIFISFAAVKSANFEDARKQIKQQIVRVYEENRYLMNSDILSANEKKAYDNVTMYMEDAEAAAALNDMCMYLARYWHKNVIILLDEYDTPVQEAYIHGYWKVFTDFIRSLFNATFKTNPYLERAVMTGITRVSKESIFSDLNNLRVVTTTSDLYADCFGFTEKEVFTALNDFAMGEKKGVVKQWYDGFTFGEYHDIYNPWSITNFLKEKKLRPYWAATSSNGLVGKLIRTASIGVKEKMEDLLNNKEIIVNFDEQIVFEQLDYNENAIWSLLLASGYLKVEKVEYRGIFLKQYYHIKITNIEMYKVFSKMFEDWFGNQLSGHKEFIPMDERLKKQLDFILEIDKEKNILRQTHLSGHGRRENDAEHAWHMAIMAYLLQEYANESVDIAKVMLMCLIHDVVEIDAGDTYAYDEAGLKTQKAREDAAKERIYSLLPEDQKEQLQSLFDEFEECESAEAKFAKAMDNLQPLLLNCSNDGGDWREHGVTEKQVYGRQGKTKAGSEKLYEVTDLLIQEHIRKGNIREA